MLVLPKGWTERWAGQDVFEQLFSLEGRVYKEKQGRKTLRFTLDGKHYFAKLHNGVGWKEIVKHLVQGRLPVLGAHSEWRAIQRLEQLGIKTIRLVGYGERGLNPARRQSFVITEELANTISLENLCRDWLTKPPSYALKRALITEVATIARTLHEHGMNHRDFYICHFLLDVSEGQDSIDPCRLRLYLIDLHRVQIRHRVPQRWRVKDIAGLYFSSMDAGLTQRDVLRFARTYWNKPLPKAIKEHQGFWSHVEKRAKSLYRKIHKREPTVP
jgi:heptose I phosphotransferase